MGERTKTAPGTEEHRAPEPLGTESAEPALILAFPHPAALPLPPAGEAVGREWLARHGVEDSRVSSDHVVFTRAAGSLFLADAGSRNGTWVDGERLSPGDEAKLSDFGLVTDRFIAGYASHQGYVDHLAPEVFRDDRTSPRSDVWAMGMTLYRMLNGEPWYNEVQSTLGVDWTQPGADKVVQALITRGGFARRLPWMPHVPNAWRRFVRKAMHDSTASRFQSGGAMLSALTLAVEPSWDCSVAGGNIAWRRVTKSGRDETVTLDEVTPGRFAYLAVSSPPVGRTGRMMAHIASKAPVSRQAALTALQAFFAARM